MGGGGLFVLFEHAAGYSMFKVKEFEEIGMLIPQVEESIKDLGKFTSLVNFVAFQAFKTGANALENMNAISEGVLHEDLELFLETNLPKKKKHVTVGVSDGKLGAAVQEKLSVSVMHTGAVPEIIRGIRLHFAKMIQGFSAVTQSKAQLGMGHSYSRAKVKFNVHRSDNMIIQSIALLDQLDKDINTFSMRIREWYSYHFPELYKIVPDNYTYAKVTQCIKNRKELMEEKLEEIEQIVMDSGKAKAIYDASKSSMGMDISSMDLANIEVFAKRVTKLAEYRQALQEYLKSKMSSVAPNLAVLIGETVGARLISHAGSLTNLAKYPASTVQILGAEKALFRALKTRGNTPKYGLLFHSTFIGRAATQNKGRISRFLANKCSMASRIDCFLENPTSVFGNTFREQVEERLKFYETGDVPRKNEEVMAVAMEEFETARVSVASEKKKKKKKRKQSESMEASEVIEEEGVMDVSQNSVEGKKKKKKKRKHDESINADSSAMEDHSMNSSSFMEVNGDVDMEETPKKKKKKKKSKTFDED